MAAKGTIELQDLHGNPITPDMIQGGDTIIAIVTPPAGYEFNRWVDNVGHTITDGIQQLSDDTFRITVECGILYKVIFKKVGDDTCSIDTFIYFNNGINETLCTNCGSIDVSTYYCNGQATIEALPNCCYKFVRWSDGNTDNPRTVGVTIGSHLEYRAIVEQKIYNINVRPDDPYMGTLYIGPEDGSYLQDTTYTIRCDEKFMLKAVPNEGHLFKGWPDLSPSDVNYSTNPRVIRFDCTLGYSSFDESAITDYIASFEETERYKIVYHSNTESAEVSYDTNIYSVGDTFVTKPSNTFLYAYHTFTGWKFDSPSSGIYGGDVQIILTSNIAALADGSNTIHLYAQWSEAQENKVVYDVNGGDGETPEPTIGYIGSTVMLNDGEGLSKEGEKLLGWCTTADGTGTLYELGSSYLMTEDAVTLYAFWSPLFVVKYDPNGGDGNSVIDNNDGGCYAANDIVTVWSNVVTGYTKANHSFVEWNTSSDGTGTSYVGGATFSIQSDVALYAIWLADETSTLSLYDADGTSVYTNYTGFVGNNVTIAYVPTRTHYVFQGWATSIGGSVAYNTGDSYTLVSGNSALYAVWTAESTYSVTYNGNGSTSGSVVDGNAYYAGDSATVLGQGNLVKSGAPYNCVFDGWYTNAQGTGGTAYSPNDTITMNGNITLYAQWSCCPITFVVNNSTRGSINVNGTTVTTQGTFNYEDESQISITVIPASGYAFIGWVDNATGLYITPTADVSCESRLAESTRYAYVPITVVTTTPSRATATLITTPTYATSTDYTSHPYLYNQSISQYFQCIDLSLINCPVEMVCGGTYTAMFVPCEYGELSLCSDCDNGYHYVESDPIYVYETIDDWSQVSGSLTVVDWREDVYDAPSTATATSPMYLRYVVSSSPEVYEYYKKMYNNGSYLYVQLTSPDAEDQYLAEPVADEHTPDYIYDYNSSTRYYKIGYNGNNVTNVTKAYNTIPTEYLGDVIALYDSNATEDAYYGYNYPQYDDGNYHSGYNVYYEWNTTNNGYTLIPSSRRYEYSNAWFQIDNIFLQTQYSNWEYIQINGGSGGYSEMYKWNGSMYSVTSDTPSSYYTFKNVGVFMNSYLRYDRSTQPPQPITSFFAVDLDGVYGRQVNIYKWDGINYVITYIIPVFTYDYSYSGYTDYEYLNELNGMFPITGNGLRYTASSPDIWVRHFGDTVNFNNNLYTWNNSTQEYDYVSGGVPSSATHAHIYNDVPSRDSNIPDEFIGTLIMYNGVLMKLRYCYGCLYSNYNMYYEPTGFTVSMNNIIGTTSAAHDGLYVTQRSIDVHSPVRMSVSPSNHMNNTYGTPTQNDPSNVMVISVYYLGGKQGTSTDPEWSIEYPLLGPNGGGESSTDYNNIPGWRARAGLTDGNPTENMYLFPGNMVSDYFIKQIEYKLFTKECIPT